MKVIFIVILLSLILGSCEGGMPMGTPDKAPSQAESETPAQEDNPPKIGSGTAGLETADHDSKPLTYTNNVQKQSGTATWDFRLPADSTIEEAATDTWILPGDAVFVLNDQDLVIAPTGSQKHSNLYNKASLPAEDDNDVENLDKFSIVGYTGVLKSLEGAGYVVLLEQFGQKAPRMAKNDLGFVINDARQLRIVFFADGGYKRMAEIIRDWMKQQDYYRKLLDKPYGEQLKGAVVMRPVQYGAIGEEVWEQVSKVVPKAVLIWKTGDDTRDAGLEKFTVELQKKLDQTGQYFFLPFAGMENSVQDQQGLTGNERFNWTAMPKSLLEKWPCIVNGKPLKPNHPKRYDGIVLNPFGLKERMEYWLYEKMPQHPNTYRTDGVNVDTLPYWFSPDKFVACENPGQQAGFAEWTEGFANMLKTVYDKGGIVSHEGLAFFTEKYAFSGYGRPLVTIGALSDFALSDPGSPKKPSQVLDNIANHIPINELVYHDQIAMRMHDGEALNMRYKNKKDTEEIRRYKFLYNALFGLTPNLQLGGEKADQWITEDLEWMRKEMPAATEIYSKTYGQAIVEHKFLTEDRLVQQCTFENGIRVTANFDTKTRTVADRQIQPLSYVVTDAVTK
jgi:hypothetical protein